MTSDIGRDAPIRTGWSQTPNGFWTLPVSPQALRLLGWLQSHDGQYLSRLSLNECRRLFGSSTPRHFDELEKVGLIRVERLESGKQARIVLLSGPWMALSDRAEIQRAEIQRGDRADSQRATAPKSSALPRRDAARKEEHLEDQRENQREHQLPLPGADAPSGVGGGPLADAEDRAFEAFWTEYKRVSHGSSKHETRGRWKRAIVGAKTTPEVVLVGLRAWVEYWLTPGAAKAQWPQGWLTARRWEAEPPVLSAATGGRGGGQTDRAAVRRALGIDQAAS